MPRAYRLGLIGFPLGHSLSPVLHQAALREFGLEGTYRLHSVPPLPEGRAKLEALVAGLREGEIQGLNVTIPHKQNIFAYLDRLSPAAGAIGAANTLSVEAGRLVGHNTDAEGFRRDLRRTLDLQPGRALILGAGGSARAVCHALLQEGWSVSVTARRRSQAEALAARSDEGEVQVLAFPVQREVVERLQPALVVNTTPLGMAPHPDGTPWPEDIPFPDGSAAYDLVYNPANTTFLEQARKSGAKTAGGTGMLIEQAALAFEIWTGRSPSREVLWAALQGYLAMRK